MGGLAYWSWLQAKKRRELLAGFAASQGWTWSARDDSWVNRFEGTPFDDGDNKEALNILQGQYRGRAMIAFDYSYETHSTDSKGNSTTTTHRFAFCSLSLPGYLPRLELVPESVLGRVGTALGMQDIELESEDFNRRYRVRCANQKFAYDVLPPRTMEALMSRTALHLRLAGTDALCWESGRHSPAELLARLDALATLVDGIPAFVWNDLKGSPS
ncbi:MAG: hypothetical protein JWM40_149 [Frankiales bacterium]|nr:hypothetical protein [Frankiales bacterium]